MNLVLEIPDELRESFENLQREILESLAARAYSKDVFSLEQVRRFLGEESRWHAQNILEDHGVWPGTDTESLEQDLAALNEVLK